MISKYEQLFEIVKAALWSGELARGAVPDEVIKELRAQSVDGLASIVIPELAYDRYNRVALFVQMAYVQSETIGILNQANISAVILKGTAAGIYYSQPFLRVYGDIDILVHPDNYQSSIELLSKNGFVLDGIIGKVETHFIRNGFIIELHQSIPGLDRVAEGGFIYNYLLEGLEDIEIASISSPTCEFPMLPWKQNGLELIWHIREHLYNGLGLRQIIDWMMFTDRCLKNEEQYESFHIILNQSGLSNLAITVTRMSQLYLGLDSNISWCAGADEDLCKQLMDFILEQGDFGRKKNNEKVTRVLTRYSSVRVFFRKLQEEGLGSWSASSKHFFLRPFAWINAGMRGLSRYLSNPNNEGLVRSFKESRKRRALFDKVYGSDYGRSIPNMRKRNKSFKQQMRPIYKRIVQSPLRLPFYYLENLYYSLRYYLYDKPTIDDYERKNVEENVTFIFKSFNRQKLAKRCYQCIKAYYPKAKVIIADDSEQPLDIPLMCDKDTIIHLPFNSGLSKGLIAALEQVDTPYTMLLDDDELLTPATTIHEQLSYLQRNSIVDLVGLQPNHLYPEKSAYEYSRIRMKKRLIIPAGTIIDGKEVVYKTANVFLARTESYRRIGYDPNIRMIIHHEFFYRAAGEIVCVQDSYSYILHCHNHFAGKNYTYYRGQYQEDARYIAQKHGSNYY